jgi:hypothetical protein
LGSSYPETGATNESGLHWDMVCDTRKGGAIYVDGQKVAQNGEFLLKSWPKAKSTSRRPTRKKNTSARKKTSRERSKKASKKK